MPRCHVCDKLHTSLDEAGYCCHHVVCERYAADRAAAADAKDLRLLKFACKGETFLTEDVRSMLDKRAASTAGYAPVDDAARELELLEDQRCGNCGSLFSCSCR